jgi:hypothetical protein
MTEMERLLAACSVWEDGEEGFDEVAADGLARYLQDEANMQRQARCVRHLTSAAITDGWETHYSVDGCSVLVLLDDEDIFPSGVLQLEYVNENGFRQSITLVETSERGPVAAGFHVCLSPDDRNLGRLIAAIRLAAIRHVLGYTADRLIAAMDPDAKK